MRTLTIIRHAKSSWDDLYIRDFDRSLNDRGINDAPRIGRALKKKDFTPDVIVTSPAVRAKQTAQFICDEVNYSYSDIIEEPAIYEASLAHLQSLIEAQPTHIQHLALIGHNPGLESLCLYTEGESINRLTTGNAVQYHLNISHWQEFDYQCGSLSFHLQPKHL